jgi:glycerol-3-phosphate responsive antiterminator
VSLFKIYDVFVISHQNILVLVGQILEGDVCKGMNINISNYSKYEILGVDVIDGNKDGHFQSFIALRINIEGISSTQMNEFPGIVCIVN